MQRASARIGGKCAGVVELVDALDSKSSSERSAGSTPATAPPFNVAFEGRYDTFESCGGRHFPNRSSGGKRRLSAEIA